MKQLSITALHGFLGLPADWSHLPPDKFRLYHIHAPNIEIPFPPTNLWKWANAFNQSTAKVGPRILMGYSLGARLAMHAILDTSPSPWDAAVIISAHPGLISNMEKKKRLTKTEEWATRFENEPWDTLIEGWNSQEVFSKIDAFFSRKESDYQREQLAGLLRHWSLGHQDNLRPSLEKLSIPILWIAGEKDQTYSEIASSMHFSHPSSRVWIAPNSGHRVPWEQPIAFQQQLNAFCDTFLNLSQTNL